MKRKIIKARGQIQAGMSKISISKLSVIAILVLSSLAGCRAIRTGTVEREAMANASIALMEVHSNQAEFEWLNTRFSGTVIFENKSQHIAGSIRIKKDAAIYISIAPILGIEVARALITPDSVKMVNRLESSYYMGDLRILSNMFNADIDFYMLQSLLLGNDFPHFRTDQFVISDDDRLVQLEAKRRTRKSGNGVPIQQVLSIDPENKRIRTNVIEQRNPDRAFRADYRKYENISGRLLPTDLQLMFADESDTSRLELLFSRTTVDVPQSLEFSVPSRYTRINLTD